MRLPTLLGESLSRRALFAGALLASSALPRAALADLPIALSALPLPIDSRARVGVEAFLRPKPRMLPRRRMDLDFAVLLMRTSYAVADELDFTPMNDFQRDFFLFRQKEWDGYKGALSGTQQGDLADPNYFDFISFAQYATLTASMRQGRTLFEELQDANGTSVLVARDGKLPSDNRELPALHARIVGERVLAALCDKYPRLAPTPTATPTAAALREGVQQIATLFEMNDFMLTSRVRLIDEGGVELALVAPATLWAQQVLRLRGDSPDDFEAMVVDAHLRRCSVNAQYTTSITPTEVIHRWRWGPTVVA